LALIAEKSWQPCDEVVDDSFICLYDVKCPIFFCSVIYWIIFEFIGLYWYSRVPKLTFPSAAALIYDDQSPVTSCHNNVIIAVCLKTADHRGIPQTTADHTADHPRTARKPHTTAEYTHCKHYFVSLNFVFVKNIPFQC